MIGQNVYGVPPTIGTLGITATVYQEIFASLNFREKNFMKNIFANDPHVQYIRCGMAILLRNLISRLSKIRKIHENLATRKLPGIRYLSEPFRALSSSFYPVDLHLLNGNFSMNITVLYAFITLHVL